MKSEASNGVLSKSSTALYVIVAGSVPQRALEEKGLKL